MSLLQHFKGDGLKAQMLKGAGGAAIVRAVNMVLMLISGVLLARTMGPENYGVYSFVLSLVTLLGLPTKAGLPTLLVRETARNQASQHWGLIKGLLKLSNGFVFIYSIIVAMLAASIAFYIWADKDIVQVRSFLWALWLLPIIAFEGIRTGALRGLRWVVNSQIPEQIIRPMIMIFLLCMAMLLHNEITAIIAIQFNIAAAVVAFLLGTFLLFNALPQQAKHSKAEYNLKPWLWSLLPLSVFAGLRMLDSQTTILLLGMLGSAEEVGLFRVASTGASLVSFGLTAINLALAPQVARLYQSGDIQKLQRMITLTTRGAVAVSLPVAVVFIVWGRPLIRLMFGIEYLAAATALVVLCIGQLINASCGSVVLVLNMTGNDKATVSSAIVALVLNVILAATLIPSYGLFGAAIGYTASLIAWNIILVVVTKKKTGLKTFLI